MKPERVLTTHEAAARLGVTVGTIWQLLKSGRLLGFKLHTHWRIKEADLERFMEPKEAL